MRMFRYVVLFFAVAAFTAPTAEAGLISPGDTVTFADGPGTVGGGEFYLTVNGNAAEAFITFCLQMTSYTDFTSTFVVQRVSDFAFADHEENGGDAEGKDYLSAQTAWLYTQLRNGTLPGYDNSDAAANAFQWAVWVLEDENWEVPNVEGHEDFIDLANQYIAMANTAVANGYSGLGDVVVLNLVTLDGQDAQDQLAIVKRVPEPASLALFGSGALALLFGRRRLS